MGKQVTEPVGVSAPESLEDAFLPGKVQKFRYDLALSFAGEQRWYVGEVAETLKEMGIKVFYDEFEKVKLWGKNIQVYLEEVYRKKARLCVIFLSEDYVKKTWPLHEGESALARALEEPREYILPVRFDDAQLPGLIPTIGYLDARQLTPRQLAEMIKEKLRQLQ